MVNYNPLDETFSALSDSTRRAIVTQLAERGEASVSSLASGHRMSLPAFLKHLRVLEQASLVETSKVGRVRHCRLTPKALEDAESWLQAHRTFWQAQLRSLDRFLQD